MPDTPRIFDRTALIKHRSRASDVFLHQIARDAVQDRLAMVNKGFTRPAVIAPFPDLWEGQLPGARIVGDDDTLPLDQGAHDLVIHALSMHWSNDPVGQLIQCRRALKPDGMVLAVLLGGRTLSELRIALSEAETAVTGGLSPRIAPMGDIRDLGGLLQRAGFAMPVADSETINAEYTDIWHLMRDLRALGETNALADRLRRPTRRAVFDHAAEIYAQNFQTASGRLSASFEFVTLTGWAPDPSQPQPLRPGSATTRLADALSTTETKLDI